MPNTAIQTLISSSSSGPCVGLDCLKLCLIVDFELVGPKLRPNMEKTKWKGKKEKK
jgi:hypothetical protein